MRHGEHNGIVRIEEIDWISADKVLEAIEDLRVSDNDYKPRIPPCFLYNISFSSYVQVRYRTLIRHLRLVNDLERFSLRLERTIDTNRITTIYVR